MGLLVSVYRNGYDSRSNVYHGATALTVVNMPGPFEPTPDAPPAILSTNALGDPIIRPDPSLHLTGSRIGPMDGGTFAATSDSRFGEAIRNLTGRRFYGALAIHDRYEEVR